MSQGKLLGETSVTATKCMEGLASLCEGFDGLQEGQKETNTLLRELIECQKTALKEPVQPQVAAPPLMNPGFSSATPPGGLPAAYQNVPVHWIPGTDLPRPMPAGGGNTPTTPAPATLGTVPVPGAVSWLCVWWMGVAVHVVETGCRRRAGAPVRRRRSDEAAGGEIPRTSARNIPCSPGASLLVVYFPVGKSALHLHCGEALRPPPTPPPAFYPSYYQRLHQTDHPATSLTTVTTTTMDDKAHLRLAVLSL